MLRAESDDRRFADEIRQILLVARREPVVAAGNDVVQLVERIAARTPGLAFLVRYEKVAVAVKRKGVRNADTCGYGLELPGRRRPLLNRAALAGQVVMRKAILYSIRVGIVRCEQSEVHIARGIERDGRCVHTPGADIGRRPTAGHGFLAIRLPIGVRIAEQGNL